MAPVPTIAHAYLGFGDIYLAAAFQLARHCSADFMQPLLQSFGSGIELSLKAYLVHAGVSERVLKYDVGHQIGEAYDLAIEHGFEEWAPILGEWPASETFHSWAKLYAGNKAGPDKYHRRLMYPVMGEPRVYNFGVADGAIARILVRAVAEATDYNPRVRLLSL